MAIAHQSLIIIEYNPNICIINILHYIQKNDVGKPYICIDQTGCVIYKRLPKFLQSLLIYVLFKIFVINFNPRKPRRPIYFGTTISGGGEEGGRWYFAFAPTFRYERGRVLWNWSFFCVNFAKLWAPLPSKESVSATHHIPEQTWFGRPRLTILLFFSWIIIFYRIYDTPCRYSICICSLGIASILNVEQGNARSWYGIYYTAWVGV